MKIELTKEWAVEIVVCTNHEVLGIDANDPEVVPEAVGSCSKVFDSYLNNTWSYVEEDSNFQNWNGGKYRRAGYCNGHFAFDFFSRDAAEDIEQWEENGDQAYGDWYWVDSSSVPEIFKLGLEKILDKCNESIDIVISDYLKRND